MLKSIIIGQPNAINILNYVVRSPLSAIFKSVDYRTISLLKFKFIRSFIASTAYYDVF